MDKMGDTAGLPHNGILYTGSRDDLQKKLRARDDRITELEANAAHNKATLERAVDWVSRHGYSTGMADTIEDLLDELVRQAVLSEPVVDDDGCMTPLEVQSDGSLRCPACGFHVSKNSKSSKV